MQHAQGDLLFIRLPAAPKHLGKTESVAPESGRIILAYGEVTGHHHSVPASAVISAIRTEGVTYLTLDQLTSVEHQEHAPIALDPGVWKVVRQREATDTDEGWVNVGD